MHPTFWASIITAVCTGIFMYRQKQLFIPLEWQDSPEELWTIITVLKCCFSTQMPYCLHNQVKHRLCPQTR